MQEATPMFKVTVTCLKLFGYFIVGLFLAFLISSMFGAIAILLSYLPIIWEILWRAGLVMMTLTAIALFLKAL